MGWWCSQEARTPHPRRRDEGGLWLAAVTQGSNPCTGPRYANGSRDVFAPLGWGLRQRHRRVPAEGMTPFPRPEADVAAPSRSSPTVSCSTSLLTGSRRRRVPAVEIRGPQQPGTPPPGTQERSRGGTVPGQTCVLPWWRLSLVEGPGAAARPS